MLTAEWVVLHGPSCQLISGHSSRIGGFVQFSGWVTFGSVQSCDVSTVGALQGNSKAPNLVSSAGKKLQDKGANAELDLWGAFHGRCRSIFLWHGMAQAVMRKLWNTQLVKAGLSLSEQA